MTRKIQYWGFSFVSFQSLMIGGLGLALTIVCIYPSLAGSNTVDSATKTNKQSESSNDLHRLDFRLEGKSCAACLLSMQRKLNSLPGVKEAVVMLKRPYGVSVIYQTGQIKSEEILAIIKEKEPNIKILEMNDASTSSIPSPLIPPFVPITEAVQ